MVAAEHPRDARCSDSTGCVKHAVIGVRAAGTTDWAYACGWHVYRVTRAQAALNAMGRTVSEILE